MNAAWLVPSSVQAESSDLQGPNIASVTMGAPCRKLLSPRGGGHREKHQGQSEGKGRSKTVDKSFYCGFLGEVAGKAR